MNKNNETPIIEAEESNQPPSTPRRFKRRAGDVPEGSKNMWLVSFTDIMALMLTFFVLLFAMSNPKKEDWENFTQKIQQNFNRYEGLNLHRGAEDAVNIEKINFSRALDLNYLRALIENLIEEEEDLAQVRLINQGEALIISLPQNILFDPGQADVKSSASRALYTLSGTLRRIKNRVEIVGHTDPQPISSSAEDRRYSSNWELSLARAVNIAAVLENMGYTNPVIVRGQASGRFSDISQDVALQERLDLSRRVDIVIMEDDGRRKGVFDIGLPTLP